MMGLMSVFLALNTENCDEWRKNVHTSYEHLSNITRTLYPIPEPHPERWQEMKRKIPEWQDTWVEGAARIAEGRVYSVHTSEDATVFDGVPVSSIIEIAERNTGRVAMEPTEHRPFVGLVKKRPSRAIAALSAASRRGEYPVRFWSDTISHWPTTASHHACRLFCELVRRLPCNVITQLSSEIGAWLEERLRGVAEIDEEYAFDLYDDLVTGLLSGEEEAGKKVSLTTHVGEVEAELSGYIIDHAINSPIGKATRAMLSMLVDRHLSKGHGMPIEFSSRFDRLLDAPIDGRDYTVCLLAERIDWLNDIAPNWVGETMIPWFAITHPRCEAAWNGVLWHGQMPSASVFEQIKDAFIQLFPKLYSWKSHNVIEENAHGWVVCATIFRNNDAPEISFEIGRACIRKMTPEGREQMIQFLGRVGQKNDDGWRTHVIPFIQSAWPKEARYQTEETTYAWISMLERTDERFADVLDAVKPFLRPMRTITYGLYGISDGYEDQKSIISSFPEQCLDLLDLIVADEPDNFPFDLDRTLQLLIEACPGVILDHRFARLQELAARR